MSRWVSRTAFAYVREATVAFKRVRIVWRWKVELAELRVCEVALLSEDATVGARSRASRDGDIGSVANSSVLSSQAF